MVQFAEEWRNARELTQGHLLTAAEAWVARDAMTGAEQTETAQEDASEIGVISNETFARLLHHFRETHPNISALS